MSSTAHHAAALRPLRLLNLYRVVAAIILYTLYATGDTTRMLGSSAPQLFQWVAVGYLAFGVIAVFAANLRRPAPLVQLYALLLVDIAAITLLTYASGGARSGLGGLLFVPVAAAGLMMPQRSAVLFAAIATIALLGSEAYAQLTGVVGIGGYPQAGILGMILFTTAVIGYALANRARESEALAAQRGLDLADLAQLNEYIIQHLQTGVVAVDGQDRIRMLNASASAFLGAREDSRYLRLREVSAPLAQCLRDWRTRPWDEPPTLAGVEPGTVLIPHLTPLGHGTDGGILVFLEDSRVVAERMQSMKLAALGRLTASIAHEIRNPLGAVSHASQLLAEADHLDDEERRLTEIIRTQTGRVNTIIETVLQLSRRQQTRPELLELPPWLTDFVDEFSREHALAPGDAPLRVDSPQTTVRMDPSHLQQVLSNLCENALRHTPARRGARVELRVGRTGTGAACLDVLDRGPGVDPAIAQHIFEPFYSASAQGTGLGLFISRELCECNQARLSYRPRVGGGSCFRISFADASRWVI
ncbi:MAG: ATP-binding protein [Gammaproteobacteria bacterium]